MTIKTKFQSLSGFKRYAAAFGAGVLMAFAMPPVGAFLVLLFSIPAFIWLTAAAPTRAKAFLVAWAFGAGYFITGLYWVSAALFVDIEQWFWVLPLSAIVGPAVLALMFYGIIPLRAWKSRDNDTVHALITVASFAAVEWLRGHVLTGFPWNLPGYAWMHLLPVMQISAYTGVYGLTVLTLLWAALPAFAGRRTIIYVTAPLLAVIALGGLRLYIHPTVPSGNNTVRVVQANIPQSMKWDRDQEWRNLEKHAALSKGDHVTFIVWPETSVQGDLSLFPDIAQFIARNMPRGATGILGTLRVTSDTTFYNSITAIDDRGAVKGVYDKHHLVPFGEYMPFRSQLNVTPIASAISGLGDFTAGAGPQTLKVEGLPSFSPLVCYEAIFPGETVDERVRPEWMVNVTNDGWYGNSAGPYQHFEITRMRAIEEGLPMVRAANTGISGVIDSVGRVIARKGLGEAGAIDSILPAALEKTIYAKFRDAPFFLLMSLIVGFAWFRMRDL